MKKVKRIRFTKEQRMEVFRSCGFRCQLCGKDLLKLPKLRIVDHKVPLSNGGTNKDDNLWLLCCDCDKQKKDYIIPEVIRERLNMLVKRNGWIKSRISSAGQSG